MGGLFGGNDSGVQYMQPAPTGLAAYGLNQQAQQNTQGEHQVDTASQESALAAAEAAAAAEQRLVDEALLAEQEKLKAAGATGATDTAQTKGRKLIGG